MRTAIARALVAGGHGDKAAEELAASVVAELVGAMALARASGEGDDAIAILSTARASIKRRIVRED
jgi:TetR/AcrR family transcriptional repressor of nem operon